MRLRNLVLLIAAISLGWWLANKHHEDVPEVVKGPRDDARTGNAATRFVSGQAQRLADQAAAKGLDAVRRARGAIRERLSSHEIDDSIWN
jgi:hypothetical protein